MSRDEANAHFLHQRPALEALVSPGVDHPRAIAWVPDDEALVLVARNGVATLFEPAFGTRVLGETVPEPARVHVTRDHIATLSATGLLDVRTWPDLSPIYQTPTGVLAQTNVVCWTGGAAVVGEDDRGVRRVIAYDGTGRLVGRVKVPARVALGVLHSGLLHLARSTTEGVSVTPVGRPPPPGEATAHTLRLTETGAVVGIAAGGVTVWRSAHDSPVTVKAFDVSAAALSPDTSHLAIGTRNGRVAYASARPGDPLRAQPARVGGHEGPVFAVEFSRRGRWLATCAERCWVWSY